MKFTSKLGAEEYQHYLDEYIKRYFNQLINKDIFSIIYNRDFYIEAATFCSLKSGGHDDSVNIKKISYKFYNDTATLEKFFGQKYIELHKEAVSAYGKKIYYLQQVVFNTGTVIKFIDMLPYNESFTVYITSYVPLIHPNGEVLAIQSTSVEGDISRFQRYICKPNAQSNNKHLDENFTNRELEILFLLTNGASQNEIAQILNVARTTISSIIANQICPKFNISGANTKILIERVIKAGLYLNMPNSLWKPCVIILNEELLNNSFLKEVPDKY